MILRLAAIQDAKQILEIYAPYVKDTCISFETIVPSEEEMMTRIKKVSEDNPWIIIEEGEVVLGYAYASRHRERSAYKWSVDVSIYVRQDQRGKGTGKTLYSALIEILKLQGYCNAYAGICVPNEASVGIHEYFGFKKIAHYTKAGYKFGQWHDVGWWELFLNQHVAEPSDPMQLKNINKEDLFRILSSISVNQ